MSMRVLLSSRLPVDIRPWLGSVQIIEPPEERFSRADLLRKLVDADALISLLDVSVDKELLEQAPKLKVVANYAVGYDNVDVSLASRRGVLVCNTPDVLTNASADLAFSLLLSTARRTGEAERLLRHGDWQGWGAGLLLGQEVFGQTLGVIGAGRIGQAVLRRAQGFEMKLLYHGPRQIAAAEALGARWVDKDTLFAQSDFLSLHCPLNDETKTIVNRQSLAKMKKSAILINTARGACVDYQALIEALNQGRLAGAGLDVFEDEPKIPEGLLTCAGAVLLPHIGSATHRARAQMAALCAQAVAEGLAGQCPDNAVNPEVMP